MTGKSKLVDDETLGKAQTMLYGLGNEARGVIKLKAIIASREHGVTLVAKIFNVSRNSINTWIKKFKRDANSILSVDSGRGRKDKLTKEQLELVKSWILSNPNLTLQRLSQKIESNFNVKYTIPGVQKIMKKLSFSYITPRPKHYKQDKGKQEEFKKKSSNRNTKQC